MPSQLRGLKMDATKKKKLIEEKIKQVKDKKKLGQKEGKNVTHAKQSKKQSDASKIKGKEKKTVAVGPKGGTYTVSADGKKEYKKSNQRENTMKDDMKKAVDSMSADVDNTPKDEATLNAENAPAIQEATTPSKQEESQQASEPAQEAQPAETAKVEEPAAEPEAAPAKEISFDGLFAEQPYQLGSTLKQDPTAGNNVMTNMKKPGMDYVERAKNHKNVSFTAEEMTSKKD